jgi:hypothetical protein
VSQSISTAPTRSSYAIGALALGLFAFSFLTVSNGPISALVGLLAAGFAFAALREINKDRATGRGMAVIGLIAGICGVLGGLGSSTTTPATYRGWSTIVEPQVQSAQPVPAVTYPLTTFGEGTYLVGAQVAPGQYVADGTWYCYWERATATDRSFKSIIANGNIKGRATVTINPADKAFKVVGNCTFTKD